MNKVNGVDSELASAGVDATEQREVDKALNSDEVQKEIASLSKDGLTDQEKDQIGAMVADKAWTSRPDKPPMSRLRWV
jgi:hypothetical protein